MTHLSLSTCRHPCDGPWIHQEYKELAQKYQEALEELTQIQNEIINFQVLSPLLTTKEVDPDVLEEYVQAVAPYIRPAPAVEELKHVPNYSKLHAVSNGLQAVLMDRDGNLAGDDEWKEILAVRKRVIDELFNISLTWTEQNEKIITIAVAFMEFRFERLALCDRSCWKALVVLKARFEEARKAITAVRHKPSHDLDRFKRKQTIAHENVDLSLDVDLAFDSTGFSDFTI